MTTISKKRRANFLKVVPLIAGMVLFAVRNFMATIPIQYSSIIIDFADSQLGAGSKLPTNDPDSACPFRNSGLYRKVYVYPNYGDVENGWKGSILSAAGALNQTPAWPWLEFDKVGRQNTSFQYDLDGTLVQYSTELLVREILTNPESCLRTHDPVNATLFYVPYLPSLEAFGSGAPERPYQVSPFAEAIMDILGRHNYSLWENVWGLTSEFWRKRNASDHILVFSEPLHGLYHPSWRGNRHFIRTQKQLSPAIVISVEVSTTFVNMFPKCAAKNILMPYPNPDGRWFNGKLRSEALATLNGVNVSQIFAEAALPSEREIRYLPHSLARPLSHFYQAPAHGECIPLRKALRSDYLNCAESSRFLERWEKQHKQPMHYSLAMQLATFCPSPHGDSPSAKRMFDSIFAGCIPVVLSTDFVWPFTTELHQDFTVDSTDFSIRLNSTEYLEPALDEKTCLPKDTAKRDLETHLRSLDAATIARLRRGVAKAAALYSYYKPSSSLPTDLLRRNVLPNGGAAQSLVQLLADRQRGARWPACEEELRLLGSIPDVRKFKC